MWRRLGKACLLWLMACQSYDFVSEPDAERQALALRFDVRQPSKADILFVVDNSGSMQSSQEALQASFRQLLAVLSPQDTSYRLGIVSTDAIGSLEDCESNTNPAEASNTIWPEKERGAVGPCNSGSNVFLPNITLRRPHDGALGRLLAAFAPEAFAEAKLRLPAENLTDPNDFAGQARGAFDQLIPTSAYDGPVGRNGQKGARWVIDREAIRLEACDGCGCTVCKAEDVCYEQCGKPVADALVSAYFLSNLKGLGTSGTTYEEGLKSAFWAVGINPEDQDPNTALTPTYNLLADNAPNSYASLRDDGISVSMGPWLREDALLAVMFVTDEQDCSLNQGVITDPTRYEDPNNRKPIGSICYQQGAELELQRLPIGYLSRLLQQKKGNNPSQIAIGVIGGVRKTGKAPSENRDGEAVDCVKQVATVPSTDCSCFAFNQEDAWCDYSLQTSVSRGSKDVCDAAAGSRYVAFAKRFSRKTFESICRNDERKFGDVLADFARIATVACFDLQGEVKPFLDDPNNIIVRRTPKNAPEQILPLRQEDDGEEGWYYDRPNNKICLSRIDRLIGDRYDIFVFKSDRAKSLAEGQDIASQEE